MWLRTLTPGLAILLASCGKEAPPPEPVAPRPVAVVELQKIDPVRPLLLTGSVESWKQEDVSFEVAGRLDYIVEPGTFLQGRWVEDGEVRVVGDVLARIDTREYDIARSVAQAGVEVAQEQTATATVQLEKVLPANRDAAKANRDRAEAEYQRYQQAAKSRAVSEIDVIKAKADFDGREANLAQAVAAIETKQAEIKSFQANERHAKQTLGKAEYDIERCVLHAPFSGEVSQVYIEAGGYAQRGQPVAHLVMMSPIKVDLAVSRATLAKLRRGDAVQLYAPGEKEPMVGAVYDKGTVADPKTRTFRVSVITRNSRAHKAFGAEDPRASMPRVSDSMALSQATAPGAEGRYFVEERRVLRKDAQGYYVWADPARRVTESAPDGTVFNLRKFRVKPGEQRASLQGIYLVRELVDIGDLKPEILLPLDVPDSAADEQKVVLSRPQWFLRPGQLVDVLLSGQPPAPGIYVPADAVKADKDGGNVLFLAVDGKAKRVNVRVVDVLGQYARIEGEGIEPGAAVIADYVHFLVDGEPVRVIRRRELGR